MSLVLMNMFTRINNQAKILAIETERLTVQNLNRDLSDRIKLLEASIIEANAKVSEVDIQLALSRDNIEEYEDRITELVTSRDEFRLDIRFIDNEHATMEAFKDTFPLFSKAKHFGYVELENEDGFKFPYVTFPLGFVDTFIILKQENESLRQDIEQRQAIQDEFGKSEELFREKSELLRRIAVAEAEKYSACDSVRQEVNDIWYNRTESNMKALKRPTFGIGSKWSFIGGTAIGIAACKTIDLKFNF
jgi:hypothetical protein